MPVTFTNKEEIANRALLKVGGTGLVSFDDETPESNLVKQVYKSFIQGLLTRGNWHFAMKKQQLTRLTETPINEWTYVYAIPADLLKLRSIFNSSEKNILTVDEYEIFEQRKLYADDIALWADYITYTDESYWPYYFVEFAITALASELAYPLTRDQSLVQALYVLAYGPLSDNGAGGLYGEAARQDSAMNPSEPMRLDYLTNARFSF